MTDQRKVFCIGFQKTGTSSMRDALELLGYRVTGAFGFDDSLDELRRTHVERGIEIARRYDAVEDMPWALMFRELDAAFPGSRFILTVREEDAWFRSIAGHFGANPSPIQMLTYGEDAPAPVGHEAAYRARYRAHNDAVRTYFSGRPDDLLVMELARGDGWHKLCPFLGEPAPDKPFPVTNTAAQRSSPLNRIRKKLWRMGLPIKVLDR